MQSIFADHYQNKLSDSFQTESTILRKKSLEAKLTPPKRMPGTSKQISPTCLTKHMYKTDKQKCKVMCFA